ncbi:MULTISPECIES: hypothetical protein [unclassified Nitrosospira]|uniref:hypothetical protein n=1 Tax=unclassified Nitrosospira TaxID=2609267 RepID=UPI000D31FD86|nr:MULTISPECIES: hypothetical protein [unclassified Nitrosospira]PTR15510.1 hypothetical protein C8R31_10394 [Nitrosospira sp. Nsp2]WON75049.1 hypothetical protein R5L00_06095 [Nitrosospira sp. Is2]
MTTTSRKARVELNASKGDEEAVAPRKRTRNPAPKQNKAVAAKSSESKAPVKSSQSVPENEKPPRPVRQAKVASESAKGNKADKSDKAAANTAMAPKKTKLQRDSYSIPESEHKQLVALKKRCIDQGTPIKKSYLLRAGIQVLALMDDDELLAAIERVK